MINSAEISLNQFYPSDSLRITEIIDGKSGIVIHFDYYGAAGSSAIFRLSIVF
jgi:hypothetical protein